jgi:autotransporter-associated beta strand protein
MTQMAQMAEEGGTGVPPVIVPIGRVGSPQRTQTSGAESAVLSHSGRRDARPTYRRRSAAIKERGRPAHIQSGARASFACGMRSLFQQARPCEAVVWKGHRGEPAPCATTGLRLGETAYGSESETPVPPSLGRAAASPISYLLSSISFALLCATSAFAQTSFSGNYTFGADGDVASFNYNGATIDNLTVSAITKNGVNTTSGSGNFRATNWPTGATTGSNVFTGSIDLAKYFEFTLTPDAGYELAMSSLTFGIGRSAAGTRQTEWRSSIDGFASTISTYSNVNAGLTNTGGVLTNPDSNSSWTSNILNLSAPAFQSLASAITFRAYFYNTESTSGTAGLQGPLSFNGTLTATGPATFTTWTGTGSPGTWSDGTAGQFGGNYANDLANTVTFAGTGTAVTASGTPQAGSLVFNSDGYSLSGAVQLGVGNITTAAATTTTLSAEISGNASSGLTKLGAGTLILSGSNSYTGSTAISAGVLEARHANALGTTAAGTTVSDGATLALSNSIAIGAETLGLSGNGSSSSGALRNLSGTNSISGAVTLNANSRIQSDAGTLTLTGGITGTGRALTIAGAGATTLSSSGLNTSTGGTLLKTDAGTLTISASSSYTGGTSVTGGTITASHNSALGTGAVTITSGTVQASSGITLGNDFTIGAPGGAGSLTTLQSWDFTGQTALATSTANVTAIGLNTDVAYNILTRGATANASIGNNSFRTTGFQNDGISTANTDYFQWQIASTGANAFSLSTLDARFAGTSGFRASPGVSAQFAYSLDNSTYTLIGSPFSLTADTAMPQIDLSGITALQGLGSDATITLRYYASGQTTTGGWGFNSPSAGQNGLELRGSVSGPGTGSATLGLNTAGTATYSGNLTIHGAATLTAAASATATFSGTFSGSGNVTKTGPGTVLLTGNAAHSGGTTVSAGTLLLNGSHASAVTVSTGATLGGNGTISGLATLNSGATLSPGNSVGNLNFNGGLTLQAGSNLVMEINGASSFDTITIVGNSIAYAGTLTLNFDSGYTPVVNQTYQLVTRTGGATASGNFASLAFSNPDYAGSFDTNSGVLTLTAVPEPKTWALLSLGASFLLWQIRRRKNFNHQ